MTSHRFTYPDGATDAQLVDYWIKKATESQHRLRKLNDLHAPKDIVKYEEKFIEEVSTFIKGLKEKTKK
jgi:hypothetical protein